MTQQEFDEMYNRLTENEWIQKIHALDGIEVNADNPFTIVQRLFGLLESYGFTILENPMWHGTSEFAYVIFKPKNIAKNSN